MNLEFRSVGCFSCIHFDNKYWCNKYDKEVKFLDRDSCHCIDFKLKDGYSNRGSCLNCFEYDMCIAVNKFRGNL